MKPVVVGHLVCLLFVWLSFSSFSMAQSPESSTSPSTSDDWKKIGSQAMEDNRFQDAIPAFDNALALETKPDKRAALIFNKMRAYQALANFSLALKNLESFYALASDELKKKAGGQESLLTLLVDLKKRVGVLNVSSNVKDAEVFVNEKKVGVTPLEGFELNQGDVRIRVNSEGYFPFNETINIPGERQIKQVMAQLNPKDTTGVIVLQTSAGAFVSVDGKRRGSAPIELKLEKGAHSIFIEKDGFEPLSSSVVVKVGERRELALDLVRRKTIFERWWFWTAIGVVAAGTTATVIMLTTEKSADRGTLSPSSTSVGLIKF